MGIRSAKEAELGGRIDHHGGCIQHEDSKILVFQMSPSHWIEKDLLEISDNWSLCKFM